MGLIIGEIVFLLVVVGVLVLFAKDDIKNYRERLREDKLAKLSGQKSPPKATPPEKDDESKE